jgi:hypothetical protein
MEISTTILAIPTEILQDIVERCFHLSSPVHANVSRLDGPSDQDNHGLISKSQKRSHSFMGPLLACKRLHQITLQRLYTHLEFRSASMLKGFEKSHCILAHGKPRRPPVAPRTISVSIHNDIGTHLFETLERILSLFSSTSDGEEELRGTNDIERDERGRFVLDRLSLQCYSHARDPNIPMIGLALESVK